MESSNSEPSKLILPNQPKPDHNLLLFTGNRTYNSWQKSVDAVTPKKQQTYDEKIDEFLRTRKPTKVEREFSADQIKSLPENFCVFCGDTSVSQDKQMQGISWMFSETIGGAIDIKEGDFVNCSGCKKCVDNIEHERDFTPLQMPETHWEDRAAKRKEAVDKRIIDYIYSQRLAGVTGNIFGDESRRERFKDVDE